MRRFLLSIAILFSFARIPANASFMSILNDDEHYPSTKAKIIAVKEYTRRREALIALWQEQVKAVSDTPVDAPTSPIKEKEDNPRKDLPLPQVSPRATLEDYLRAKLAKLKRKSEEALKILEEDRELEPQREAIKAKLKTTEAEIRELTQQRTKIETAKLQKQTEGEGVVREAYRSFGEPKKDLGRIKTTVSECQAETGSLDEQDQALASHEAALEALQEQLTSDLKGKYAPRPPSFAKESYEVIRLSKEEHILAQALMKATKKHKFYSKLRSLLGFDLEVVPPLLPPDAAKAVAEPLLLKVNEQTNAQLKKDRAKYQKQLEAFQKSVTQLLEQHLSSFPKAMEAITPAVTQAFVVFKKIETHRTMPVTSFLDGLDLAKILPEHYREDFNFKDFLRIRQQKWKARIDAITEAIAEPL